MAKRRATKKTGVVYISGSRRLPASDARLRVVSFFAGIGGFDLGFERAGMEPVFHCEINAYCRSVLKRHWPTVEKRDDIRSIDPSGIPEAEIWCGGFPCQDVSVARGWLGRDGLKGENTGLFYPFVKLVEARLPQVVVMENVSGLLSSHDGRDFAIILHSFLTLGYGVAWRILNTRYFGAPQSRARVYICAWRNSADSAFRVLYEGRSSSEPESPRLGFLRASRCKRTGAMVPEVAFCLAATSGRHTGTDWSRSYVAYRDEVRRLTPTECERIQGFPAGWTLPGDDFHLADADIDSLRYHAAGNAVSVPVVEWVGKRVSFEIKRPERRIPVADLFDSGIARFVSNAPDFKESKTKYLTLPSISSHEDAPKIKWSNGGVMEEGNCVMAPVSTAPSIAAPSRFVDALDDTKPDGRYFLSPNAAKGILRRVNSQKRQLFEPLAEALNRLQRSC